MPGAPPPQTGVHSGVGVTWHQSGVQGFSRRHLSAGDGGNTLMSSRPTHPGIHTHNQRLRNKLFKEQQIKE